MCRNRTDQGKEFENLHFTKCYQSKGIFDDFFARMTMQQNVVLERKNQML